MAKELKSFAIKTQSAYKRGGSGKLSGFDPRDYSIKPSGLGIPNPLWDDIKATSKLDVPKSKLRWGGNWIPHRKNKLRLLYPLGPPSYSFRAILKEDLFEEEKSELIRFLLCLKLWETTPGEKIISPQDVWLLSLQKGPEAAEILDDLFSLTWREKEMKSYNFCFPARFLPRFEEASDDIQWSLSATYADPDELNEFRSTLRVLLENLEDFKEHIELPSDQSILDDRTTTTSYIHALDKKLPHWEASFCTNEFATKELISQRCVVNVYPGGTRDTIIADKAANNSIRWIDRSVSRILTYVPESAVTSSPTAFKRRWEDVVYTKGHHVLRDIKKCGLTYNSKDLFPIVKEELQRFIPDIRWNRLNIFQKMTVYDDEYVYTPQRGYGLGMANAVVTLCNIVIYHMIIDRFKTGEKFDSFKSKGIFGNDDSDVVFYGRGTDTKALAEEYLNFEHEIQGRLGNLTNLKKSVVKPYGLFYENYGKPGWHTKESLICNALACAYLAPDIRVAKNYIFSQSDRFSSKWAQEQLLALVLFWGGEFFDPLVELKIHYEIGGWLDYRSLGLKTTVQDALDLIDKGIQIQLIDWARCVCNRYMQPPRPEYKTPGWVKNSRYEGPAKKVDSRIQLFMLGEKDLLTYYKKLTTFQRNFERRLTTFNFRKSFSVVNTRDELIQKIIRTAPWYQIPWQIVEERTWRNDLEVNVASELALKDLQDSRAEKLIEYALYPERDPIWRQRVEIKEASLHPEVLDVIITCEIGQIWSASQFSNSGALPLLEYFTRRQVIPHIPLGFGTPKLIQSPDPKEIFYTFKLSRERKRKEIIYHEDLEPEELWGSGEIIEEENLDEDLFSFIQEYKDSEEFMTIPEEAEQPTEYHPDFTLDDSAIDRLLEIDFGQTEQLGSFIASQRWKYHAEAAGDDGQAEPIDLFDDDEDFNIAFD